MALLAARARQMEGRPLSDTSRLVAYFSDQVQFATPSSLSHSSRSHWPADVHHTCIGQRNVVLHTQMGRYLDCGFACERIAPGPAYVWLERA